jgi:hypothetical protein
MPRRRADRSSGHYHRQNRQVHVYPAADALYPQNAQREWASVGWAAGGSCHFLSEKQDKCPWNGLPYQSGNDRPQAQYDIRVVMLAVGDDIAAR